MGEWVVCPHCRLRHTERPDGICPRCKEPTAAGDTPYAPPASHDVDEPAAAGPLSSTVSQMDPETVPLGARVAGAFMLVNGIAVVIEKAVLPASSQTFGIPILAFIIAVGLLSGKASVLKPARWLTALSGVGFTIFHLSAGNALLGGFQLLLTAGLLLLLLGTASIPRMAAGALLALVPLTFEAFGLLFYATGSNPLARMAMSGELESSPAGVVQGVKLPYQVTAPGTGWYLRKAASMQKDNPLADRWLVRPDRDAHILVIAETLPPGTQVDMERFSKVVVDNARKNATSLTVLEETPLLSGMDGARLVHTRTEMKGLRMEFYYGLFAQEENIFQVVAWAQEKSFPELAPELKGVVASFRYP